jgi:bacteriocin-like protein
MKTIELNQQEELTTEQLQQITGGGFIDNVIAVGRALGYGDAIDFFLDPFGM